MSVTSLSDAFNLPDVIKGLAGDLAARRAGSISIDDARVRCDMAKQIFNGLRLVVTAQKHLEQSMKQLPSAPAVKKGAK